MESSANACDLKLGLPAVLLGCFRSFVPKVRGLKLFQPNPPTFEKGARLTFHSFCVSRKRFLGLVPELLNDSKI